jgi:hypothetical protein
LVGFDSRTPVNSLKFGIDAWAAWLPGREGLLSGGAIPAKEPLPLPLRRRIGENGRKALEAAWTILPRRGVMPRLILSSRHGEYDRTFRLLREISATGEVSPRRFQPVGPPRLIGLLSIATQNTAGHSAIAAGPETFGFALLEAVACLEEDRAPVLLMHFDESLPSAYGAPDEPSVAIALLLSPEGAFGMDFAPSREGGDDCLATAFAGMLETGARAATANSPLGNWRWTRE